MTFKHSGRYSVPSDENFEPGSNDEVLKNNLGIKSKADMEVLEEQELERTELELLKIFNKNHQFTAEDICNIHELWLGDIYPFAELYRTVNMAKGDFLFSCSGGWGDGVGISGIGGIIAFTAIPPVMIAVLLRNSLRFIILGVGFSLINI